MVVEQILDCLLHTILLPLLLFNLCYLYSTCSLVERLVISEEFLMPRCSVLYLCHDTLVELSGLDRTLELHAFLQSFVCVEHVAVDKVPNLMLFQLR